MPLSCHYLMRGGWWNLFEILSLSLIPCTLHINVVTSNYIQHSLVIDPCQELCPGKLIWPVFWDLVCRSMGLVKGWGGMKLSAHSPLASGSNRSFTASFKLGAQMDGRGCAGTQQGDWNMGIATFPSRITKLSMTWVFGLWDMGQSTRLSRQWCPKLQYLSEHSAVLPQFPLYFPWCHIVELEVQRSLWR